MYYEAHETADVEKELAQTSELLQVALSADYLEEDILRAIFPSELVDRYMESGVTLRFTSTPAEEASVYAYLQNHCAQVLQYQSYLDNIAAEIKSMQASVLFADPNSYSSKSLQKSAEQYAELNDVVPRFENDIAVSLLADYSYADWFLLAICLTIALSFALADKEQNLQQMLYVTALGNRRLPRSKALCCAILSAAFAILCTLSSYAVIFQQYEVGTLGRSIQSVQVFYECPYSDTVLSFLLKYLIWKVLFAVCFTLLTLLFFTACKRIWFMLGAIIIIMTAEALFFIYIHTYDAAGILAKINIFKVLDFTGRWTGYQTVNLFSHPSDFSVISTAILVFICILSIAGLLFWYGKYREHRIHTSYLLRSTNSLKPKVKPLFLYECKICLQKNGVAFLILLIFSIQWLIYLNLPYTITLDDLYEQKYIEAISGKWTQQKEDFLMQEKVNIEQAKEEIRQLSGQLSAGEITQDVYIASVTPLRETTMKEPALDAVTDKLLFAKANDVAVINEDGYHYLLGVNNQTKLVIDAAIGAFFVVICVIPAAYYRFHFGMEDIIFCTKSGERKIRMQQIAIQAIVDLCITAGSFFSNVLFVTAHYGWEGLAYSSKSIEALSTSMNIPVWGYLFLTFIMRWFGLYVAAICCALITWKVKKIVPSLIFCLLLFVMPFAATLADAQMIMLFPLQNLQIGNSIIRYGVY